jgi:hypothetical protein
MKRICYMVTATLPSAALADEYVAWLAGGHVDDVVRAGALTGSIVRLDVEPGSPARVMAQYTFASRAALEEYVRERAPALRADGLKRFGPETGVKFERGVGEIER